VRLETRGPALGRGRHLDQRHGDASIPPPNASEQALDRLSAQEEALDRLAKYRAAARMAAEADHPLKLRLMALMDLIDAARSEEDEFVRSSAEAGVWEEARSLFGAQGDEPSIPTDPVELAARQLRAKGEATCPTCARPLHDELDFARWRALRQLERERLEARRRPGWRKATDDV
jgi:hypothetical protein